MNTQALADLVSRLEFEAAALIATKGRVPESSDVSLLREAAAAITAWNTRQAAIGGVGLASHRPIQQLLYFTEHAVSASEEGVDYAIPRAWLDVLTAMGIMEKTGRGRWSVTDSAQALIDAAAPALPAAGYVALDRDSYVAGYKQGAADYTDRGLHNPAVEDDARMNFAALTEPLPPPPGVG